MKGYNLQQHRCTSSSCSHSLSHTITKIVYNDTIQYNTIQYSFILQCFSFIGEIPWENTTVNSIPWVRKTVGQQTSQIFLSRASPLNPRISGSFPLNPKVGEQVYSKPGVKTHLNNISGSGRSGSTINMDSLLGKTGKDSVVGKTLLVRYTLKIPLCQGNTSLRC